MLSLFLGKERVKSGWDLYPLQRMISEKNFLFFCWLSSFYFSSFSSFACHIFKEASPCQNCQLLLHKLCPLTENWKRLKILKHYASVHIRLRKSIIGYVNVLVNLSLILYLTLLSYDFVTLKGFPSNVWFCICFISFPWQKKSPNSFSKLL